MLLLPFPNASLPNPVYSSSSQDHRDRGGEDAVDIPYPSGTLLYPIHDCTILTTGYLGSCGNHVEYEFTILAIGTGAIDVKVRYCHLDSILVTPGQNVAINQAVGTVGNTGESYGPHLHLILWVNGVRSAPEYFLYPDAPHLIHALNVVWGWATVLETGNTMRLASKKQAAQELKDSVATIKNFLGV